MLPKPPQSERAKVKRSMQHLLEFLDQSNNVTRYSRDFMFRRESLLEHMGFTATFCLIIGYRLREDGIAISMSELLERAIAHDIEEVITGDVSRTTKYATPETAYALNQFAERSAREAGIMLDLGANGTLFDRWKNAKDESLEGCIVKMADFAAVIYKVMSEYAMLGNKTFGRVAEEISQETHHLIALTHKHRCLAPFVDELIDVLVRSKRGDIEFTLFVKGQDDGQY